MQRYALLGTTDSLANTAASVDSSAPSSPARAARVRRLPRFFRPSSHSTAADIFAHCKRFKLVAIKLVTPSKAHLENHCALRLSPTHSLYVPAVLTAPKTPTSRRSPSSPA